MELVECTEKWPRLIGAEWVRGREWLGRWVSWARDCLRPVRVGVAEGGTIGALGGVERTQIDAIHDRARGGVHFAVPGAEHIAEVAQAQRVTVFVHGHAFDVVSAGTIRRPPEFPV